MNSRTEGRNHGLDLRIGVNLVKPCLLHVQNLSAQGKNGLRSAASRFFRRTACGISLNDINLAVFRILVRAVRQLSGKGHALQRRFSSGQLSCLSGRFPGPLRQDGFLADGLGNGRILLQIIGELLADHAVNSASRLGISQLLLGLSFKLGILDFHADDGGHALADILSAQVGLAVL